MCSYWDPARSARRREIHSPVRPANTDRLALGHGPLRLCLSWRGAPREWSERIARGINTGRILISSGELLTPGGSATGNIGTSLHLSDFAVNQDLAHNFRAGDS